MEEFAGRASCSVGRDIRVDHHDGICACEAFSRSESWCALGFWELLALLLGGNRYEPAFGRSTPFTARVLPNATVKFAVEPGWNPAGVKAVTAPASATATRDVDSILNCNLQDCAK
jgi:hypothetical protein